MSRITGTLSLTLYEAKELAKEDFGKMDPYCKVEVAKKQGKTKVHKKGGQQAQWNQTFDVALKDVSPNEIVHFQVWDEDVLSDDKIGRADITLTGIAQHTDKKDGAWIQLVDFDNFKKIAGYVRIGVKFTGEGWPKTGEDHKEVQPEKPPTPERHDPEIVVKPPPTVPEKKKPEPKKEEKIPDTLHEGNVLVHGESLLSANGQYSAVFQSDSNFVVYHNERPVWAAKTNGSGGDLLVLQNDNNLVIYSVSGGKGYWDTKTGGKGRGKARLVMQNDGNLVIYDEDNVPLWGSGIPSEEAPRHPDTLKEGEELKIGEKIQSQNGQFAAIMQKDGNFVVYSKEGAQWSTMTDGTEANKIILQTDSNLVVYAEGWKAKWSAGTAGKGKDVRLVIQNDGNLVLSSGDTELWSSWGIEKKETDTLEVGGRLGGNDKLTSADGKWRAVMQRDGNFVVYSGSSGKWSTRTQGKKANNLYLQRDHNLVVRAGLVPVWSTETGGKGSSARLVLQNDGNLVLLDGTEVLWSRKQKK